MSKIDIVIEKLKAAPPEVVEEVYALMERMETAKSKSGPKPAQGIDDLIGVLKNSTVFEGDPVEIQRAMRDEWT